MSVLFFKALNFAKEKHKGQIRRGSKQPYVTHPMRVADLIGQFKDSKNMENLLAAAMLHDTLEDTETSYEEIEREFNPMVASIVQELTSDDEIIKQMGKNEYLKEKMVKLSSYGLFLKLLDRLDNVSDGPTKKYIRDTIELIAYIEEKRRLSASQKKVVDAILKVCNKFQSEIDKTVDKYL